MVAASRQFPGPSHLGRLHLPREQEDDVVVALAKAFRAKFPELNSELHGTTVLERNGAEARSRWKQRGSDAWGEGSDARHRQQVVRWNRPPLPRRLRECLLRG